LLIELLVVSGRQDDRLIVRALLLNFPALRPRSATPRVPEMRIVRGARGDQACHEEERGVRQCGRKGTTGSIASHHGYRLRLLERLYSGNRLRDCERGRISRGGDEPHRPTPAATLAQAPDPLPLAAVEHGRAPELLAATTTRFTPTARTYLASSQR